MVWTGPIRTYPLWWPPKGGIEQSVNHTIGTAAPVGAYRPPLLEFVILHYLYLRNLFCQEPPALPLSNYLFSRHAGGSSFCLSLFIHPRFNRGIFLAYSATKIRKTPVIRESSSRRHILPGDVLICLKAQGLIQINGIILLTQLYKKCAYCIIVNKAYKFL